MTLPASGEITLNDVNVELGNTGTDAITIGSADVRDLFGVASGEITMADGHGKSSVYSIDNSCRFNKGDVAKLSRVLSTSNRQKFTLSTWFKLGAISSTQAILTTGDYGAGEGFLNVFLNSAGRMTVDDYNQSGNSYNLRWSTPSDNALLRDPSAWYHLVIAVDTTQGTQSNRVKIYINGSDISSTFTQTTNPSQNANFHINNGYEAFLGGRYNTNWPWDGYLADINFIDGTAELPSAFGETGDYGEWKPIEYSGTYGTNGFYLDFADSGNLGDDESGNGNDFTENNLSATDQMLDTPTNNFCTFNPIQPSETGSADFYEGNLKVNVGDNEEAFGTFGVSSGKWYFEMYYSGPSGSGNNKIAVGIADADTPNNNEQVNHGHSGTTYTTDDIIGVAVNVDDEEITFYKNNSAIETDTDWSGKGWTTVKPIVSSGNSAGEEVCVMNFGADSSFAGETSAGTATDSNGYGSFKYTPPSGYLALCTANLPDVDIVPSEHFDAQIYTGSHSSDQDVTSPTITGVDLVWLKSRSHATNHALFDRLRGTKELKSDKRDNEVEGSSRAFGSLLSNGVELLGTNDGGNINQNPRTYAAWMWKAGGSGVSNTDGSVTSTVSANVDAGFSIVSYTGTGANATVGHGLSSTPEMIITKNRDSAIDSVVYHSGTSANPQNEALSLSTTSGNSDYHWWNDTAPTNAVFNLGNANTNNSGDKFIAYCFHSVDGYSKVGSYTGNGNADGPFISTGHRVAWFMVKNTNGSNGWRMFDNKRLTYNPNNKILYANASDAEATTTHPLDFLSNGIKIRGQSSDFNENGDTYIYLAFAETPFKYSNAR